MKLLITLFTILYFIPAHASYYRNVCSSADSSVRWEEGHDDNTIYFSYYDYEANEQKKFQLDFNKVNFEYLTKRTIKRISSNDGCDASFDHHYHSKVSITPTAEVAEEFKQHFKSGKVERFVICHDHISGESTDNDCE